MPNLLSVIVAVHNKAEYIEFFINKLREIPDFHKGRIAALNRLSGASENLGSELPKCLA